MVLEACLLDDAVFIEEHTLTVQRPDDFEALQPPVTLPSIPLSPRVALPCGRSEPITVQQRAMGGIADHLHRRSRHLCRTGNCHTRKQSLGETSTPACC